MINVYEFLNVKIDDDIDKIKDVYNFKIKRFKNLPFLTDQMKKDIKILKIAKYLLFDEYRRKKYNNILINELNDKKNIQLNERLFSVKF